MADVQARIEQLRSEAEAAIAAAADAARRSRSSGFATWGARPS